MKLLAFDIDGVITDGAVIIDSAGIEQKGDLVLPAIFNDYSHADEGHYEYKKSRSRKEI